MIFNQSKLWENDCSIQLSWLFFQWKCHEIIMDDDFHFINTIAYSIWWTWQEKLRTFSIVQKKIHAKLTDFVIKMQLNENRHWQHNVKMLNERNTKNEHSTIEFKITKLLRFFLHFFLFVSNVILAMLDVMQKERLIEFNTVYKLHKMKIIAFKHLFKLRFQMNEKSKNEWMNKC